MERIKSFFASNKVKGIIAIAAAIIMYYTPDHIDRIIETILAALGIQQLTLKDKE